MNVDKIKALEKVREKFRTLLPAQRERIGISLLKINIGVESDADILVVHDFMGDLPLELKAGKLDALMNYLHASGAVPPPEMSGWFDRSQVTDKGLPPYNEDEVETLREPPARPVKKES